MSERRTGESLMPEFLTDALGGSGGDVPVLQIPLRLSLALIFGFAVAAIYAKTQQRPRGESLSLVSTLVLLCILIAMVTLVIGNSVARAFSLVGALAIVRFRTVVEDTRDTAFVIFAVVVGMGVGCGYLLVPLVGIPVVGAAAWMLSQMDNGRRPDGIAHLLAIRLTIGRDPETSFRDIFAARLSSCQVRQLSTVRQGAALEIVYNVHLRCADDAVRLVDELNQVDGIQSIELKQA